MAVGLLGVGLIMVAAIFPVALTEHRWSVDRTAADALAPKADAILRHALDPNQLYLPIGLPTGVDSPWYLLRSLNLESGAANWTDVQQPGTAAGDPVYANLVSGFKVAASGNLLPLLTGLDTLSDQSAPFSAGNAHTPFSDFEFQDAAHRLAWYAFYRRRAGGGISYSVAVCKIARGDRFIEQDANTLLDHSSMAAQLMPARYWRLPLPWRVRVGFAGGHQLSNSTSPGSPSPIQGGVGLATLAPPGSRLMVQGSAVFVATNSSPVPSGRILTVSNVVNDSTVEVVDDLEDFQLYNFSLGTGMAFDVWLIPPPQQASGAGRDSPVLAWRTSL